MSEENKNFQNNMPENSGENVDHIRNTENEAKGSEGGQASASASNPREAQEAGTNFEQKTSAEETQAYKNGSAPAYGVPNDGNRYEYPFRRQAENRPQNQQTEFQHQNTQPPQANFASPPDWQRSANEWSQPQGQYPRQGQYADPNQYAPQNQYAQNNRSFSQNQYPMPREDSKNKKKNKARLGAGGVALIIVCTLIFSTIFGSLGVLGTIYYMEKQGTNSTGILGGGEPSVIYQSVPSNDNPNGDRNENAITYVNQICAPTVVEITTESLIDSYYYGQYISEGAGSGVIITSDGYIITNNHVIADTSKIKVTLNDGTKYDAVLVGTDSQTDIAVIKIDAEGLSAATLGDSSKIIVGETVVAIGNPLGQLGGTITDGIISALDREITIDNETMTLLQTNVAVNPGNSGGGLFNIDGELIGIVNAKKTGTDIEGIGFAIPINTTKDIIEQLMEFGYVKGRVVLGISAREINDATQAWMYRVNEYGVYVTDVQNGDFNVGDRIMAIDGNSIASFSDIKKILRDHKVGDEVTVTVSRSGRMVDLKITLVEYIPDTVQNKNKENQPEDSGNA